jgi:hypothetical protein
MIGHIVAGDRCARHAVTLALATVPLVVLTDATCRALDRDETLYAEYRETVAAAWKTAPDRRHGREAAFVPERQEPAAAGFAISAGRSWPWRRQ